MLLGCDMVSEGEGEGGKGRGVGMLSLFILCGGWLMSGYDGWRYARRFGSLWCWGDGMGI